MHTSVMITNFSWRPDRATDRELAGIHFSFIAGTPGAPGVPAPS